MLHTRIDRHRCIGAGNCIALAPTAFDWLPGELMKVAAVDLTSIDDEQLRQAALSCPTQAIVIEDVETLLPWQLRDARGAAPERVMKTFMFTDIVKSTNLIEVIGDDAWETLRHWHDEALRAEFAAFRGEEVVTTGDGFFVGFESPDTAIDCAIAIQRKLADHRQAHGFAPQVRIGLHASMATMVDRNFSGKGVHEAARIAALATGGEILASSDTAGSHPAAGDRRSVELKGITEPVEVVAIKWR